MKKDTSIFAFSKQLKKDIKEDKLNLIDETRIRVLSKDYDITEERAVEVYYEVKGIFTNYKPTLTPYEERRAVYDGLDVEFIKQNPDLVVYSIGDNEHLHEYVDGVYKKISEETFLYTVDNFIITAGLLEFRGKRYKEELREKIITRLRNEGKYFLNESVDKQKLLLNLRNGLFSMEEQVLYAHNKKYFSTSQSKFDYVPKALCVDFLNYVNGWVNSDEDSIKLLQEIAGYCLTNGNPRHKIFYFYGKTRRNGKSTLARILKSMVGENSSSLSLKELSIDGTPKIAALVGSQLNFTDEASSEYLDSPTLTSLIAEGDILVNEKYYRPFNYRVKSKFIVACNNLPNFKDQSGMETRTIVVEFPNHIEEADRIADLETVLLEKEGPGILNWAILGYKRLCENNSFTKGEVEKEVLEYHKKSTNHVYGYLNDENRFIYTNDFINTDRDMSSEQLFGESQHYEDGKIVDGTGYYLYCKEKNVRVSSLRKFQLALSLISEMPHSKIKRIKSDGYSIYRGLIKK